MQSDITIDTQFPQSNITVVASSMHVEQLQLPGHILTVMCINA